MRSSGTFDVVMQYHAAEYTVCACTSVYHRVSLEERLIDGSITEVVVDVCGEKTPVPVICDVTSIVDLSNKVLQSIPGNLFIVIQVKTQEILTHLWGYCKINDQTDKQE